jgi:hypothetical protein
LERVSRHKVEIRSDGPLAHRVLIDGTDIARSLTGLTLHIGTAGEIPKLTLDVQLIDVTELGSVEAEVLLGQGVAETLKKLGWTPPEEDR